MPFGP